MPNFLVDNKVNRVDLVKEGSCSVADILIIKGKDGAHMPEAVQEIINKMKPEHQTVVLNYLQDVEKAKTDALAQSMQNNASTSATDDTNSCKEALKKACNERDTMAAELKKAQDKIKQLEGTVSKSKSAEENFEEVMKSMPEAAQAILKQMKQTNDTLIAKAKEAEEKAENELAVAKAKDLSVLPIEQDKLVSILKSKPSNEVIELLENLAKAAEKSDIFVAKGVDTAGSTAGSDAFSQVEAKATEIAKAKSITIEKARLEVFEANPKLYEAYNGGAE